MPLIRALVFASLFSFAAAAYSQEISRCCNVLQQFEEKDRIEPEAARSALMTLKSLRVIRGDEDDPIFVELKTGEIHWIDETTIRIGRFVVCELKTNSWYLSFSNKRARFFFSANGIFKRRANGTWRAVRTGGIIT